MGRPFVPPPSHPAFATALSPGRATLVVAGLVDDILLSRDR
jgi:hypothetical protein